MNQPPAGSVRLPLSDASQTPAAAVARLAPGGVLEIAAPVVLTEDLVLPESVSLAFGPFGRLNGPCSVTGRNTRLAADPQAFLFGPEVRLAGTWEAAWSPCWFGAVYDGATDCTDAIQKCLDRRGEVRLRGTGTALIRRALVIAGGTCLRLDPGFTVRLADGACCPMLRTRWADQRYFTRPFPDFVRTPDFPRFVRADDAPSDWTLGPPEEQITISGGAWDAEGGANPRQDHLWGSFGFWGCLMQIVHVRGFILRDTRLYDATTYFFDGAKLSDFTIDNIHMDMRQLRPNQDGIHLEGDCFNGVIRNIHGRTWDDMVALNGGDSWYPKYPANAPAPARGTGTNVLWTPFLQGGIRQVRIRDIHVSEGMTGYRAVRLLSTASHPMDDILIDGVTGRYLVNAILISAHYEDEAPYGTIIIRNLACDMVSDPGADPASRQGHIHLENGRVTIETLILDGARYRCTAGNGPFFRCPGRIRRLLASNLDLSVAPDVPPGSEGVFQCAPFGRALRGTDGKGALVEAAFFSNVAMTGQQGARPAIAFQGRWRRLKMAACRVEADRAFDLAEPAQADVQSAATEFVCREMGLPCPDARG